MNSNVNIIQSLNFSLQRLHISPFEDPFAALGLTSKHDGYEKTAVGGEFFNTIGNNVKAPLTPDRNVKYRTENYTRGP